MTHTAASPAQRGAAWLLERLQADGSLRGAKHLGDYYKAPFALAETGHTTAADRLLDFVGSRFLTPAGDLDGTGLEWYDEFRIYPHAWLTIASLMRGRFEIARPLLRAIIESQDEAMGGFFGTADGRRARRGHQEVMTTSIAGLACLWAGRLDVAQSTGRWLQRLYEAQPDLARGLYFVWDAEKGGLVTQFPPEAAKSYLVDAKQQEQWYFEYGIAAAFLARLSAATGEPRWLALAQQFLRATSHCSDDVYRQPQSGKIGWGAAWTYRLSGDGKDRELVKAVAAGLGELQLTDGAWSALTAYAKREAAAPAADLDVTSEFVGLLGCMEGVLSR